jgi:hypothetical protein
MDESTKLARVGALREAALRLFQARGVWKQVGDSRMLGLDLGDLSMLYRTPFQVLPKASEHVRYLQAMLGAKGTLPYAIDVWCKSQEGSARRVG